MKEKKQQQQGFASSDQSHQENHSNIKEDRESWRSKFEGKDFSWEKTFSKSHKEEESTMKRTDSRTRFNPWDGTKPPTSSNNSPIGPLGRSIWTPKETMWASKEPEEKKEDEEVDEIWEETTVVTKTKRYKRKIVQVSPQNGGRKFPVCPMVFVKPCSQSIPPATVRNQVMAPSAPLPVQHIGPQPPMQMVSNWQPVLMHPKPAKPCMPPKMQLPPQRTVARTRNRSVRTHPPPSFRQPFHAKPPVARTYVPPNKTRLFIKALKSRMKKTRQILNIMLLESDVIQGMQEDTSKRLDVLEMRQQSQPLPVLPNLNWILSISVNQSIPKCNDVCDRW